MALLYEDLPLRIINYPSHEAAYALTREVLDTLAFDSFLDAGCGNNPNLGLHILQERKAKYFGIDIEWHISGSTYVTKIGELAMALYPHLEGNGLLTCGDIAEIGEDFPKCDVSFVRAVLAHNSPKEWPTIIRRLLSKTQKALVCMEYNWYSQLLPTPHPLARRFIELSEHLSKFTGTGIRAGVELLKLSDSFTFTNTFRAHAPECDHRESMIEMCTRGNYIAYFHGEEDLANEFTALIKKMEATPFTCVPEELIVTTIIP